jgi:DNA-3-methyladenine glycosylase II
MAQSNTDSLTEQEWQLALEHLVKVDTSLSQVASRFPGEFIQSSGSAFQVLSNSIVGQQISVKAASAIFGRLTVLLGEWIPEAVESVSDAELREAGLSVRKVEYLRGLASAFHQRMIDPDRWRGESDEQVIKELVALRGIGRWTAEMFLIFHLKRPDVLPLDDLGLLQSAARVFGWDYPFYPKRLKERAEAWRPWRTVGVWYLWRALDPHPVVY